MIIDGSNVAADPLPAAMIVDASERCLETSVSLLDRLRHQPDDQDPWRRLDALYRPLIASWLRMDNSIGQEAEDLVQEIMEVIVREISSFERERMVRRWLRIVTLHRLKNYWRRRQNYPRASGWKLERFHPTSNWKTPRVSSANVGIESTTITFLLDSWS